MAAEKRTHPPTVAYCVSKDCRVGCTRRPFIPMAPGWSYPCLYLPASFLARIRLDQMCYNSDMTNLESTPDGQPDLRRPNGYKVDDTSIDAILSDIPGLWRKFREQQNSPDQSPQNRPLSEPVEVPLSFREYRSLGRYFDRKGLPLQSAISLREYNQLHRDVLYKGFKLYLEAGSIVLVPNPAD